MKCCSQLSFEENKNKLKICEEKFTEFQSTNCFENKWCFYEYLKMEKNK